MNIEDISSQDLFRVSMNRLWIRYDLGGISVGRSYQSAILESIMHLFESEDMHRDIAEDFISEVERRTAATVHRLPAQMDLAIHELSSLSNPELAYLAFKELERWYKEEAEQCGFFAIEPANWFKMLRKLCLLAFPEISLVKMSRLKYRGTDLIREGESRYRRTIRMRGRQEDFERFNINPWNDLMSSTT